MGKLAAIFYPASWPLGYLHGTMDEIYRLNIFDDVRLTADAVVVDAGANIGQVTRALSPLVKRVYAIEADPDIFQVLKRNRDYNAWDNVSVHHFALNVQDSPVTFHRYTDNPFAGTLVWDGGGGDVTVPGKSLGTFMAEEGIDHIHFLKLDIEGAEHALIQADDFAEVANRIDTILLEQHYDDTPALSTRLRQLGFREERRPFIPKAIHLFHKQ